MSDFAAAAEGSVPNGLPGVAHDGGRQPHAEIAAGVVRGLENDDGANHCFLNATIQALWHVESFRERFLRAPAHAHQDAAVRAATLLSAPKTAPSAAAGGPARCGASSGCACEDAQSASEWEGTDDGCEASTGSAAERQEHRETCCFCALKHMFSEYQVSERECLPPDAVRTALSQVYNAQGRFRAGDMEDATETLEALLDILHACSGSVLVVEPPSTSASALASARASSAPGDVRRLSDAELVGVASRHACQPLCIAHKVFGMEYIDLRRCTFCGATGEPCVTGSFTLNVYVADLLQLQPAAAVPVFGRLEPWDRQDGAAQRPDLHDLLWKTHQRTSRSLAAEKCRECNSLRTLVSERWLTLAPCTFVLSLVWPDERPSRASIRWILSSVRPKLSMSRVFRTREKSAGADPSANSSTRPRLSGVDKGSGAGSPAPTGLQRGSAGEAESGAAEFVFRGMVCFSGMHYIAIFWSVARSEWVVLDDTDIRFEGQWRDVVAMAVNGGLLPTLLLHDEVRVAAATTAGEASLSEMARQIDALSDGALQMCTSM